VAQLDPVLVKLLAQTRCGVEEVRHPVLTRRQEYERSIIVCSSKVLPQCDSIHRVKDIPCEHAIPRFRRYLGSLPLERHITHVRTQHLGLPEYILSNRYDERTLAVGGLCTGDNAVFVARNYRFVA
jgi:hypothetical protein